MQTEHGVCELQCTIIHEAIDSRAYELQQAQQQSKAIQFDSILVIEALEAHTCWRCKTVNKLDVMR